ncbi:MAG: hypothetical protein E3J29_05680, partial [Dehalococcoidia bacterium]
SYVVAQLGLDPQRVRALEDNLRLAEDVIRHLVVKLEEEVGGPDAPEAHPPLAERS